MRAPARCRPSRALTIAALSLVYLGSTANAIAQSDDETAPKAEPDAPKEDAGGDAEAPGDATDPPSDGNDAKSPDANDAKPKAEPSGKTANGNAGDDAAVEGPKKDEAVKDPVVTVGGYLQSRFDFRYIGEALPRDKVVYGFGGLGALIVDAKPFEAVSGRVHVQFRGDAIRAVDGVSSVDRNGDGANDSLFVSFSDFAGISIQEASIRIRPLPEFGVRVGALRIPFSLQQQSSNTALLFPTRARPNEIFLSGADLGALLETDVLDGVVQASAGVFNGDSLGLRIQNAVARGVVISGRADVNPFGRFDFDENDTRSGPFRLGVGAGLMFRPATIYDVRTGTEARQVNDLRFSASLRMAYRGLYFGAEYFRRQQSDNFSSRQEVADGAYAQVGFFIRAIDTLGIEPIGRLGFVAQDETFDTRLTGFTDAGVNFYPIFDEAMPRMLRLTVQYVGERRFTEDENAHGANAAAQLQF